MRASEIRGLCMTLQCSSLTLHECYKAATSVGRATSMQMRKEPSDDACGSPVPRSVLQPGAGFQFPRPARITAAASEPQWFAATSISRSSSMGETVGPGRIRLSGPGSRQCPKRGPASLLEVLDILIEEPSASRERPDAQRSLKGAAKNLTSESSTTRAAALFRVPVAFFDFPSLRP